MCHFLPTPEHSHKHTHTHFYACICNSQQTAAQLSEVSTLCLLSGRSWFAVTYLLSWTTQQGSPRVLAVTCLMAMCQLPTSHWLIFNLGHPKDVCHYMPEEAEEWVECEQPTDSPLASLIGWWWLWSHLSPGVLREGHWHLDGSVSPVCVCCPAGVRSS